uniref:Fatty acid-binding protein, liver n=1 Tax=Callorhinchus milii TaxID=7868 RepID=K4GCB5_CALMI|nr:Fatty acid-binding protein, liver [Callorhinchus milii]AFM89692.1 Fatty acid-binding protein, liver [Callorhinchus milii]AFM89778.1 Fatty acid-binding protein, liver [Callorhinchus milii]AFM90139.1 Fatty acid-binding protein, liver [Callorhinchus milii]AFM90424.1 Fatty acid-binding protein, liver [Callorhinchus milii]|eukprot:gi/632954361/ref/XP_007892923.1/ PREDICTED: fatty acid-binding protein, liver [Callorhinchus milii]
MMAFSGTWQVYSQENIEDFLRALSLPEEVIKIGKDIKPVIDIKQTGEHFVIVVKTSQQTVTNEFTVGKEAEITSMDGKKLKCTVQLEDGKLVCKLKSFTHIQEVQGNEMIEKLTAGNATMIRKSRRM